MVAPKTLLRALPLPAPMTCRFAIRLPPSRSCFNTMSLRLQDSVSLKWARRLRSTVTHGLCTLAATSLGRTFSCLFGKKKEGNAIEVTLSLEQKLCGGKCLVHARGRRSQWADWLETDGRRQQFNKLHVFRRRSAVAFEEREVTE